MRFRILAINVMVVGMIVAAALAADVTGGWVSESQGSGEEILKSTFTFKADGSNLTGTMTAPVRNITRFANETTISEGRINGDEISFVVKRDFEGKEITIKYKGKVAGDEIKLTVEVEGGMGAPSGPGYKPMQFTLKRIK